MLSLASDRLRSFSSTGCQRHPTSSLVTCVRVLLTLVLIAAVVWQSESWPPARHTYLRPPIGTCFRPSFGRNTNRKRCTHPIVFDEGDTCRYTCRHGYSRTSGDTSRTCRGDRSWSGQPLVCKYTACGRHPPYTSPGVSSEKGCPLYTTGPYMNGENCTYECKDGYRAVSGESVSTCKNGNWTEASLTCKNTGCEYLPKDVRVQNTSESILIELSSTLLTGCKRPYVNGETCTYTCNDGFSRVSGDSKITCVDGTWSGTPLACEYTGCYEPQPASLGRSSWGCEWPYLHGDTCSYTCDAGFSRVSGDSNITCVNRTWSGKPLGCGHIISFGCQRPKISTGSRRTGCWWPYENGEKCKYSCKRGRYKVSGDSTITCVDGSWSGTPLECRRSSCNFLTRHYPVLGPFGCRLPYEEGETCRFECGWPWKQKSGDTTTTCTGGQWSGDPLVCTWPWI